MATAVAEPEKRPVICLLTLAIALLALEGAWVGAERPVEVAPGCFRKDHKVSCLAWQGPLAPVIPPSPSWRDVWALDLSSSDVAKRVDMATRGATCDAGKRASAMERAAAGRLGSALQDGVLPALWLRERFRNVIVLYLRGAGLRSVHSDAFVALFTLQHVYLSSNRIERLPPNLWRENAYITGVYLDNNMGLVLPEEHSLFDAEGIEILDLSGCGLSTLPAAAFSKMPRLQTLRLERNCLTAVSAEALAPLGDLWSLALGENAISGLGVADAALLARLPDALLHGNPWRCDCALRDTMLDTMRALDGDAKSFWEQAMGDLLCLWPPEDAEQSWEEVLHRDECREYNATAALTTLTPITTTVALPPTPTPNATVEADAQCCGAGGGCDRGVAFCKWALAGALLLLALGLLVFTMAAFSGRVTVTASCGGGGGGGGGAGGGRRGRFGRWGERGPTASLSRADLVESAAAHDNGDYLHEGDDDGGREGREVVRFG